MVCTGPSVVDCSDRTSWTSSLYISALLLSTYPAIVILRMSSGSYASLLSNPGITFCDTKDIGRRFGMFMSIFLLGALARPPISGVINMTMGGFEVVRYYADSTVLVGVAMMCVVRHMMLGHVIGEV